MPSDSIIVSDCVGVSRDKSGTIWWFHDGTPIGSHDADDVASFRMYSSMMCDGRACKLVDIQRAFGVSSISVKRALKLFRAEGARGFFTSHRTPRSATVLTPECLREVQGMLDEGLGLQQIADRLDLKRDTLYRAVKAGRLNKPAKKGGPSSRR